MNFPDAKEVFTSGHPKSGNTWLNRLLTDMLCAPLQNDHNEPIQYYGVGEYNPEYVVRKLHLPWNPEVDCYNCYSDELRARCVRGKLIFIHRDPRAVIASTMHYTHSTNIMGNAQQVCRPFKEGMCNYEAWVASYVGTSNADYIVTYENLLNYGVQEMCAMYEVITGKPPEDVDYIRAVCGRQSFENIKHENDHFYWRGRADTWKEFFTYEVGEFVQSQLGDFLAFHGFETDPEWYKAFPKKNGE